MLTRKPEIGEELEYREKYYGKVIGFENDLPRICITNVLLEKQKDGNWKSIGHDLESTENVSSPYISQNREYAGFIWQFHEHGKEVLNNLFTIIENSPTKG